MRLGVALGLWSGLAVEIRPRALLVALRFRRMVGEEIVNSAQPGAQALA
ncbi:MAG: hypothetical protein JO179_02125 [Solirubrobacterales bacterium]|nr:hypothetical protein [Solirubrobacterales bacterium]